MDPRFYQEKVVIVGIKIPFWHLVVFMVKWTLASIPALIILAVIGGGCFALMGLIFTL